MVKAFTCLTIGIVSTIVLGALGAYHRQNPSAPRVPDTIESKLSLCVLVQLVMMCPDKVGPIFRIFQKINGNFLRPM